MQLIARITVSAGMLLCWFLATAQAERGLLFETDVLPIFAASCNQCHSGGSAMAKLDLTSARGVLEGSLNGRVVVPGASEKSYLFERITTKSMPPEGAGKPLTAEQVEIVRRWIDGGANKADQQAEPLTSVSEAAPPVNPSAEVTEEDRSFWAFRKPAKPALPRVRNGAKVKTPVDAFLLKKLEEKGLTFSPEASKTTLLRRAYFDLTGLPPSPQQVKEFLADSRPDAYEKLIDRLLDSPRYGERWGRHWLDTVGYNDEQGFANDLQILSLNEGIWRYRDYVIRSFNSDKPYDQFLTEQLAGDELVDWRNAPAYDQKIRDSLIATGYLRLMMDLTNAAEVNSKPYYYDVLVRASDNLTSGVLGLTGGCARCHDHKYDPIPQRDYYRLLAVFATAFNVDQWVQPKERWLPDVSKTEQEAIESYNKELDRPISELTEQLKKIRGPHEERLFTGKLARVSPESLRVAVREAFEAAEDKRTPVQKYLFTHLKKDLTVTPEEVDAELADSERKLVEKLEEQVATLEGWRRSYGKIQALWDMGEPPAVHLLLRGAFENPGPQVEPGFLQILSDPGHADAVPPPDTAAGSSGRRLALARWLTRSDHPLTSRVMVNRIWTYHFGRGIVSTLGNFGRSGSPPTHPELLDWLATDFVEHGWKMKRLHKLLMTSTAYKQSSRRSALGDESLAETEDPSNELLWRMNLRRAEAEVLRDGVLASSGALDETMFGPPVSLDGAASGLVTVSEEGSSDQWRRSVYLLARRNYSLSFLDVFDFPIMALNCTHRTNSATPLQSLTMLNSEFVMERSRNMADRVIELGGPSAPTRRQVELAFLLTLSRQPKPQEIEWSVAHVDRQERTLQELKTKPSEALQGALASLCQMLLATNEFMYIE